MKRYLFLVVALLLAALYLFPLYWMYATALRPGGDLFRYPPEIWPSHPHFEITRVFLTYAVGRYVWNSLVVASGTTLITMVLGTGAAYVLARSRHPMVSVTLFVILVLQVLPPSLMVTPIFVAFNQLGLLEWPRLAVVLATSAKTLPFYIILCRATFAQVPGELEQAALVDGNSRVGAFFHIMLPLARNGILVVSTLVFLQSFGEYVYSRSLIASTDLQTATVGLSTFLGANAQDWAGLMTYASIYVTPILVIFILLQRHIVSGLTAGALK
ncbi:carbohydrate ABC transporter permease [Telmatospirillum sp.]|uniref:carbohydrate ABC transporter permease n=1 Tax=Telmatospirillum sp. TaxID=2079197 RepID=UPI00283E01E0|nr:carbohydrate ABC transporter permease [Telmatospirillum sp.]MDR3441198.1 carbohydrate ABC transporter permease [Telmatospirillum sp.]